MNSNKLFLCLITIFSVFFSTTTLKALIFEKDVEYLVTSKTENLPFSDAVRIGNMLYLSGEIAIDPVTHQLVQGDIKDQAKQIMENIKATLEKFGSSMNQIVKCTVMIGDMKEWQDFNEVYLTYFENGRLPARSAFGANGLAKGAKVEVECWAIIDR